MAVYHGGIILDAQEIISYGLFTCGKFHNSEYITFLYTIFSSPSMLILLNSKSSETKCRIIYICIYMYIQIQEYSSKIKGCSLGNTAQYPKVNKGNSQEPKHCYVDTQCQFNLLIRSNEMK